MNTQIMIKMDSEVINMVDEILKKLTQPIGVNCQTKNKRFLDDISNTSKQCLQAVEDNVNSFLLDVKDSAEYIKTQDQLNSRLQELHLVKQENQTHKAKKAEETKCVRAEEDDLKKQLKKAQQDGEKRINTMESRLEKERAAFAAYLALCGHVRLGTAPEAGGELRGCVSVEPSEEVTFSLEPASLGPVRLADRLWKLAADGPSDKQRPRLEGGKEQEQEKEKDAGKETSAVTCGASEEDKENEEVNVA